MKYTASFFIRKFKAIPARLWTTGQLHDKRTGKRCALGHCARGHQMEPLRALFRHAGLMVSIVNDEFDNPQFPQKTPRGRILAALRSIKKS